VDGRREASHFLYHRLGSGAVFSKPAEHVRWPVAKRCAFATFGLCCTHRVTGRWPRLRNGSSHSFCDRHAERGGTVPDGDAVLELALQWFPSLAHIGYRAVVEIARGLGWERDVLVPRQPVTDQGLGLARLCLGVVTAQEHRSREPPFRLIWTQVRPRRGARVDGGHFRVRLICVMSRKRQSRGYRGVFQRSRAQGQQFDDTQKMQINHNARLSTAPMMDGGVFCVFSSG
jgi:hypothetical protein